MSNDESRRASLTDWERVLALRDEDIDLSDIPEVTAEQMQRAVHRIGGKVVEKKPIDIAPTVSSVEEDEARSQSD